MLYDDIIIDTGKYENREKLMRYPLWPGEPTFVQQSFSSRKYQVGLLT